MKFFPLFHRTENKTCLIVGGGNVALKEVRTLLRAGVNIHLIAQDILPELENLLREAVKNNEGKVSVRFNKSAVDTESLDTDYLFIVAATNDRAVNAALYSFAKQYRIPVNVSDDQYACDFVFPEIIAREPLTIAVSNNDNSPFYSDRQQQAQVLLERILENTECFSRQGEVYLIGAGPGDPDLLTLRAFHLLQQADVVLYDRLVSEQVMALIPPGTERIYVGKRRDHHQMPQQSINELLVEHAKQGKRVARLKGGDPFIFGRGGEEIETLVEQQVPFHVVPGISAANGCSAYTGIPLTHRDYAQSVQFVTGQLKNGTVDLDWSELITPGKTLVFYMSLKILPLICHSLVVHGMKKDMPVALIEKGTTPEQRVLVSSLEKMEAVLNVQQFTSPSLFIVGEVVNLAEKSRWYNNQTRCTAL